MSADLARYYPYLVYASTALGLIAVMYLLVLRVSRNRRGR